MLCGDHINFLFILYLLYCIFIPIDFVVFCLAFYVRHTHNFCKKFIFFTLLFRSLILFHVFKIILYLNIRYLSVCVCCMCVYDDDKAKTYNMRGDMLSGLTNTLFDWIVVLYVSSIQMLCFSYFKPSVCLFDLIFCFCILIMFCMWYTFRLYFFL